MPRRHAYRLQRLKVRGAAWKPAGKFWDERSAVYEGDQLAKTTTDFELRVLHGREVVEHWVLREIPERTDR